MVTTVVLLIAAVVLARVVLGVLQRRRRSRIGLSGSTVLSDDDSRIGSPTLHSERLDLSDGPISWFAVVGGSSRWNRSHARGTCTTRTSCRSPRNAYWSARCTTCGLPTAYLCSRTVDSTAFPSRANSRNDAGRAAFLPVLGITIARRCFSMCPR
jgi:hypothetical protein